jgi:hypothetical protein
VRRADHRIRCHVDSKINAAFGRGRWQAFLCRRCLADWRDYCRLARLLPTGAITAQWRDY